MRLSLRCPRCGEFRVGSFNSLCLTCYGRVEGALHIAKTLPSGVVVRGG